MSGFTEMQQRADDMDDLEGGGSAADRVPDRPDEARLFAPFTYNRSLVLPSKGKGGAGDEEGKKSKKVEWKVFPPSITQEVVDVITLNFVPRDSDIWIATFPKSGTTWAAEVGSGWLGGWG
jgi:hypothetical protein